MTSNSSTGFTPFFLVYGDEAIMPTDIEHDAPRVVLHTEKEAKQAREDRVDLLEEARDSPSQDQPFTKNNSATITAGGSGLSTSEKETSCFG